MDRGRFLQAGAAAAAALSASSCRSSQERWRFVTDAEGRTLGALCDQIVPPAEYPGAAQTGAVEFIDRQLMRHYRKHRAAYRRGLTETDQLGIATFGHAFASLGFAQQTGIVPVLEGQRRPFFDLVLNHTMQSFYGSPRHGGNRDAAGWRMLGVPEPPVRGRSQFDGAGKRPS